MDNFDLAKKQLKPETEGELKIEAAYQGLYKQMVELFRGLGLEATPGACMCACASCAVGGRLRGGQGPLR